MSDQPDLVPPSITALRARMLMVGAFVGAVLAMSLSWAYSWGPESEQMKVERETERVVAAREAAFRSPPGSCLTWTEADAGDVRKVTCEQEHLFEVIGVADLADEYPPRTPVPDLDAWRELTEQRCGAIAGEYLAEPLDPEGKLALGVLRPDSEQWAAGDRLLHCGLQWVGPGGELQKLSEPVAEVNQSNVWEPGTCLALVGKTVGDPISCSEQHSYEIIGLLDLRKKFEEFPSPDDQKAWLDRKCSELAKKYTGDKDLEKEGLILSWDVRARESWDAGSTLVNCKVGAVLPDDSGLAPVRGSVSKPEPTQSSKPPPSDSKESKTKESDTEPETPDGG